MTSMETEISEWCIRQLATILEMPAEKIDPDTKFARLGMDSIHMSEFVVALEERLKMELDPEVALDHPTVSLLVKHLATLRTGQAVA
jgi:acyl carrier protein